MERKPRVSNLLYWKSTFSHPNLKIWCITYWEVFVSQYDKRGNFCIQESWTKSAKNGSAILKHVVENSKSAEFSWLKLFELHFYKILISKRHKEICILSARKVFRLFSFLVNVQESEHISFDFERSYLSRSPFQSIFLNRKLYYSTLRLL